MCHNTSIAKYHFINNLFLRLSNVICMDYTRIVKLTNICPPFGPSTLSDIINRGLFSHLKQSTLVGSRPGIYSSFRESSASDTQKVVGHIAGLHEISIERDSRAAFTLWRYPSPQGISSGFEVRKKLSLVTDEPHFTRTLTSSKGLDAWQVIKFVVCPDILILLLYCRKLVFFCIKFLSFLLLAFSTLFYFIGSLNRFVRVATGPEGSIRNDHLPEDSGQSPGHGSSGLSLDTGFFEKSLVTCFEVGVKFSHLESRFAQSPSQSGRTGLGDLAGVFLPVGDVTSFCEPGPAGDGISVFKPAKIAELSEYNEPQYFTDPLGACKDSQFSLNLRICFDNTSDVSKDGISLPFDIVYSFEVVPENLSLDRVELFSVGQEPSMHGCRCDGLWSSGIGLTQLPADDGFDPGTFPCDSVPLSGIHSQMSDFQGWNISDRDILTFQNMCYLGGNDLVGIGHSWPQLAQIQSVDEMDLVCQGLQKVPEPIIGPHGFYTNTERFGQRLDEFDDGSGAMILDRNFLDSTCISIGNGIGGRRGMQINA